MTRTIRRLRAITGSLLAAIGAAVGTFLVLVWTAINVVQTGERVAGQPLAAGVPEPWLWVGALIVAAGCTIWLERGGYRHLRADPGGGATFAILSLVCLPVSVLPGVYALAVLVDLPAGLVNPFLLGCVVVGGWLAFYDGLERLGLDTRQFVRGANLAFWPILAVAVVGPLFPIGDTLTAAVGPWGAQLTTATVALGLQVVVIVVGVGLPQSDATEPVHSLEE